MTGNQLKKVFWEALNPFYTQHELQGIWNYCLNFLLQTSSKELILDPEKHFSKTHISILENAIERLKSQEPIQYITGYTWFHGLDFLVDPNVLIPRPETEELVNQILKNLQGNEKAILDIGTGSGCIACSLKKEKPEINIVGVDVSELALELAEKNNQRLCSGKVKLLLDDVLEPNFMQNIKVKFDVLVSNPPYIPLDEMEDISQRVKLFEPHLALFCKDQPLLFYKAISKHALKLLKNEGLLYFEVHENYALEVANLLYHQRFSDVNIIRDFYGKNRIVHAKFDKSLN